MTHSTEFIFQLIELGADCRWKVTHKKTVEKNMTLSDSSFTKWLIWQTVGFLLLTWHTTKTMRHNRLGLTWTKWNRFYIIFSSFSLSLSFSFAGSFSIGYIAATSSGLLPGNVSFFNKQLQKRKKKTEKNCKSRKPERNLREAIHPTTASFRLNHGKKLFFPLHSRPTNWNAAWDSFTRWYIIYYSNSSSYWISTSQKSKSAKSSGEKKRKSCSSRMSR